MPTVHSPAQDRLATPVREFMRPGVVTIPEHASLLQAKRAMVRHRIHAVLVVAASDGRPLGWVTAGGLLPWLERDLSSLPASHAITEPPHRVEPGETARDALAELAKPGVSHLLVCPAPDGPPHGVIAPIDIVDLVTHP
jgi:CBS domain-containing protein